MFPKDTASRRYSTLLPIVFWQTPTTQIRKASDQRRGQRCHFPRGVGGAAGGENITRFGFISVQNRLKNLPYYQWENLWSIVDSKNEWLFLMVWAICKKHKAWSWYIRWAATRQSRGKYNTHDQLPPSYHKKDMEKRPQEELTAKLSVNLWACCEFYFDSTHTMGKTISTVTGEAMELVSEVSPSIVRSMSLPTTTSILGLIFSPYPVVRKNVLCVYSCEF